MKRRIYIALAIFSISSYAQVQMDTTWTGTYGGDLSDGGRHIIATSDNGFFITGYTYSSGAGRSDVYLVKTDADGQVQWEAVCGGAFHEYGNEAVETSDGGFAVVGWTASTPSGDRDVYLVKVDAQGALLWEKTFGGSSVDEGYSLCETADYGLVISGRTESFGAGEGDLYLIKTDPSGSELWTKVYGENLPEWGNSVRQADNGDLVIAGTKGTTDRNMEVSVLRTDGDGEMIWWTLCGDTDFDWGEEVVLAGDGSIYVVGYASIIYEDLMQNFILNLSSGGRVNWTKKYGLGSYYDVASSAVLDGDVLYVFGAAKNSQTAMNRCSLFQVTGKGDVGYHRVWNTQGSGWGESICRISSGEFAAVGQTHARGVDQYDVLMMKITDPSSAVEPETGLSEFELHPCSPNPFNPETHIHYTLKRPERTALAVYDILGRVVWNHVDEICTAGRNTLKFDGSALPAGVYFIRLNSEGKSAVRKMILMK